MSKAEEFIKAKTRIGSNTTNGWRRKGAFIPSYSLPWLTPEIARKAVEIAREEIYGWLEENAVNFVGLADNEHPAIGDTKAFYGTKSLIHYLKQAMKDE
jgi:hypothetical protein